LRKGWSGWRSPAASGASRRQDPRPSGLSGLGRMTRSGT